MWYTLDGNPTPISTRRYVLLDVDEIYFLESDGHDTWVRTVRRTRVRSVRSLGQLEKVLKPHGFVRVHKSYLVNLDRVREVNPPGIPEVSTI